MSVNTSYPPCDINSNRISILETRTKYIEESAHRHEQLLNVIDNKVDMLFSQVANYQMLQQQLARIEINIVATMDRLYNIESAAHSANIKTKIIWGLLSAILVGVLVSFFKHVG